MRAALIVAAVACGGSSARDPAHARAERNDFPDNPQVAHVPADTPYAFAMFKPLPAAVLRKYIDELRRDWPQIARDSAEHAGLVRAIADEVGTLDPARVEQLGFSTAPRAAIYGIGPWPVVRFEIADGERVFALAERVARRVGVTLPAAIVRGNRRHWIVDTGANAVLVAIARDELVVAIAPRAALDDKLALILGDELPAQHADTARFRELAKRDGFSGYFLGYVDVPRAIALAFERAGQGAPAGCRDAALALARRVPRLAMGWDEIDASHATFGMVLELAPELVADARALSASLPSGERLLVERPLFGAAASVDVDRLRALFGRFAAVAADLGARCDASDLVRFARGLDQLARQPLPIPLSGPISMVVSATAIDLRADMYEGYLAVYADDVSPLVQFMAAKMPGLPLAMDGRAVELPAAFEPYTGHVASSHAALAVAVGAGSERAVADALAAKPSSSPPPLVTVVADVERLREVVGKRAASSLPSAREVSMELTVDERGVVVWMAMAFR